MVKPKHLRLPFRWEERRVLIQNNVWFVPPRPVDTSFVFPGWENLFDADRPISIEYCSGNGDWIVERAKNAPQNNWLAVEKKLDRVKKIWSKMANNGLTNLVVVWAEAFGFTKQFLDSESIQEVFVNFPDPWPKRKHAKNRLICPEFAFELARVMKPKGVMTLVTDDEAYAASMLADVPSTGRFVSLLPEPFFQEAPADYGFSFFESLFREQNKTIKQFLFSRL
jgi:tRNA (guanine-N7-)-methyltransferase